MELTQKQRDHITEIGEKWLSYIGTQSTDEEIRNAALRVAESMGCYKGKPLPHVVVLDSPMACELAGCLLNGEPLRGRQLHSQLHRRLYNQIDSQLHNLLHNQIGGQLYRQLDNQLDSQLHRRLYNQFDSQLYRQLYNQIGGQLYRQLHNLLHNQFFNQLFNQFDNQIDNQLCSQLDNQTGGQSISKNLFNLKNLWTSTAGEKRYKSMFLVWWSVFYEAGQYLGVNFDPSIYQQFQNYNRHVPYVVPFEGVWFVSRKPTSINWQGQLLHAEGKKAVEYADGWGWYTYEGTAIPEKYGKLPPNQWKPQWIDEEKNADIRTALLKGIGYDRWISETGGKVTHEQTINGLPYQLITRHDPAIGKMVFLKMKNPSVPNVFHVEPVKPTNWMTTCEKALLWRIYGDEAKNKTLSDVQFRAIK